MSTLREKALLVIQELMDKAETIKIKLNEGYIPLGDGISLEDKVNNLMNIIAEMESEDLDFYMKDMED